MSFSFFVIPTRERSDRGGICYWPTVPWRDPRKQIPRAKTALRNDNKIEKLRSNCIKHPVRSSYPQATVHFTQ
jgi:hypothetical protein